MPKKYSPTLLSARRYYELFKADSIEGNIFNYETPLRALGKIKVPVLAVFGRKEEYAVIPPREMLRVIRQANAHATTVLVPGTHGFRGGERQLQKVVTRWVESL